MRTVSLDPVYCSVTRKRGREKREGERGRGKGRRRERATGSLPQHHTLMHWPMLKFTKKRWYCVLQSNVSIHTTFWARMLHQGTNANRVDSHLLYIPPLFLANFLPFPFLINTLLLRLKYYPPTVRPAMQPAAASMITINASGAPALLMLSRPGGPSKDLFPLPLSSLLSKKKGK
ncbi:hypothetical protein BDZ91DRAFT_785689 [Kalaharituber pfeilii]|nr:hypothetical protein BDZ91DRAFT_785689 [Kalaharituber pfeilii]